MSRGTNCECKNNKKKLFRSLLDWSGWCETEKCILLTPSLIPNCSANIRVYIDYVRSFRVQCCSGGASYTYSEGERQSHLFSHPATKSKLKPSITDNKSEEGSRREDARRSQSHPRV